MGAAQTSAARRRSRGTATLLLICAAVAFMMMAGGPGDLLALPHIANTLATGATPHSISAVAAARQSADERAVPRRMAAAVAAPERTALQQLATCTTFACLREVHSLPRPAGARFNYPHAIILGYPKCATTSLAAWLDSHPQAVASNPKEPEFFSYFGKCAKPGKPWHCDRAAERRYILHTMQRDAAVESGLTQAHFEASTGYSWGEHSSPEELSAGIRQELPWLRLIFNMREPISQTISGRVHVLDLLVHPKKLPYWYKHTRTEEHADESCLRRANRGIGSMHACVQPRLAARSSAYSDSLAVWLEHWPRDQLHIIQYENLTAPATHGAVLGDLQRFLGLDTSQAPDDLPQENSRKAWREGWPMTRTEYEELVWLARQQAEELAALLEQHGFYAAGEWMAAWEAAWRSNLDSCDESGHCMIQVT